MNKKIQLSKEFNHRATGKDRFLVTHEGNGKCSVVMQWWSPGRPGWVDYPHFEDQEIIYTFEAMRILASLYERIEKLINLKP